MDAEAEKLSSLDASRQSAKLPQKLSHWKLRKRISRRVIMHIAPTRPWVVTKNALCTLIYPASNSWRCWKNTEKVYARICPSNSYHTSVFPSGEVQAWEMVKSSVNFKKKNPDWGRSSVETRGSLHQYGSCSCFRIQNLVIYLEYEISLWFVIFHNFGSHIPHPIVLQTTV